MTAPVLLLFFAALRVLGGRVLNRASWPSRAPALGILAWQALTASPPLSVAFTG